MEHLQLIYYYKKGQQSTSINTFIRHAHHLLMGVSDELPPNSKHLNFNTASQIVQLQIISIQFLGAGGKPPAPRSSLKSNSVEDIYYLLPSYPNMPNFTTFNTSDYPYQIIDVSLYGNFLIQIILYFQNKYKKSIK